jgi:hypothetical protein
VDPATSRLVSTTDAAPNSPLRRANATLSNSSNDVANCYITTDSRHLLKSPSQLATMVSTSHRYLPYPLHKRPQRPSSRFSVSTHIDPPCQSFDLSICDISDIYGFPYSSSIYNTDPLSTLWKHVPTAARSNWGSDFRSGSPYSDDSTIVTPVSEHEQHAPFIQQEEEECAFAQAPLDSLQSLCFQHEKRLCHGSEVQPVQLYLDITGTGHRSGCRYETIPGTVSDSYKLLLINNHDNLTPSTPISPSSCSFATTYPQFISPFSDSAVTSMPQTHPLYAPRPVRPIPKVCFTAPIEDTLPTTSILYKAVSDSVKQDGWSA